MRHRRLPSLQCQIIVKFITYFSMIVYHQLLSSVSDFSDETCQSSWSNWCFFFITAIAGDFGSGNIPYRQKQNRGDSIVYLASNSRGKSQGVVLKVGGSFARWETFVDPCLMWYLIPRDLWSIHHSCMHVARMQDCVARCLQAFDTYRILYQSRCALYITENILI